MLGKTLSHYRIIEKLGSGGMGEVYAAQDTKLDRTVALKVLPAEMSADPRRLRRFEHEAKAVAALNHPNVVTIYSVEEAEGVHFLTMELAEGKTLEKIIPPGGLSIDHFFDIAVPLTEALIATHSRGIAHRDLKPSNVIVSEGGQVKVLDFGLAKHVPSGTLVDLLTGTTQMAVPDLTQEGQIVGTVPYMSPEQLRGKPVDHRSDIFSLGVIFYEMVVGRRPFGGDTSVDLMSSILKEKPQPVTELNAELPSHLGRIIALCLEKDADRRIQTAGGVGNQLRTLRQELDSGDIVQTGSVVASPPSKKRRWTPLLAVALGALVLGIAGSILYQSSKARTSLEAPSRPGLEARPSIAVIGFKNLGQPDAEWLSTALSEMFSTDLAAGESLRLISGESVARTKRELDLPQTDTFALDTLRRIRQNLGADYVVLGSFLALEGNDDVQLRLQLRMQDTTVGDTVTSLVETASLSELFDLVSNVGNLVRQELGLRETTAQEVQTAQATLSSDPEAMRLYSQGLDALRNHDAVRARELLEQAVETDPSYAMAHSALSRAWSALGYDARAEASARRALDLAEGLARRDYLEIQGRYHETAHEWQEALETYRVLSGFFPDNLTYGIRLAGNQTLAGRPQDALVTIEELREQPSPDADSPRIDIAAAEALSTLSDYQQVAEVTQLAADVARELGASSLVGEALRHRSYALRQIGKPQAALEAVEESVRQFEATGDRGNLARVLSSKANLIADLGDNDAAYALYEQALAISREIGDQAQVSTTLNSMALELLDRGELVEARQMMEGSLATVREIDHREKETRRLSNLGWILLYQGELGAAARRADEALEASRALGRRGGVAASLLLQGNVHLASGGLEEAARNLTEALTIFDELSHVAGRGFVHHTLGRLLQAEARLAEADEALKAATQIRQDLEAEGLVAETHVDRAALLLELGKPEEAEELARAAVAKFEGGTRRDELARSSAVLARAIAERGRQEEALAELARAQSAALNSENPSVRLGVAWTQARLLRLAGEARAAIGVLEPIVAEAAGLGLVGSALDARLELAQARMTSGETAVARQELEALAAEAESKGYRLVADRARQLLSAETG